MDGNRQRSGGVQVAVSVDVLLLWHDQMSGGSSGGVPVVVVDVWVSVVWLYGGVDGSSI